MEAGPSRLVATNSDGPLAGIILVDVGSYQLACLGALLEDPHNRIQVIHHVRPLVFFSHSVVHTSPGCPTHSGYCELYQRLSRSDVVTTFAMAMDG